MSALSNEQLITTLAELPEHALVETIALALEKRRAGVCRPEWEEAKLCLAEVHRFNESSGTPTSWELRVLARPQVPGEYVSEGDGPAQEGACCGVTLAAFAKRIVCPICGRPANAT